MSKNVIIVRLKEHFDATFLLPLLATLSHRESSSRADGEQEVRTIHVSSAYNCNNGKSRILSQGMPLKKFHIQFSKSISAIR